MLISTPLCTNASYCNTSVAVTLSAPYDHPKLGNGRSVVIPPVWDCPDVQPLALPSNPPFVIYSVLS